MLQPCILLNMGEWDSVRVLMGLGIGYEGYDGKERWMNEVGIKKWVSKSRERKGGGNNGQ